MPNKNPAGAKGGGTLHGRVILVTGGSRGIGFAISEACARHGATVALAARGRQALDAAARRLGGAEVFPVDVTDERGVKLLFLEVARKFRRLDALVNNAGVFTYKSLTTTSLAEWNENLAVNLTSLYLTTRTALPLLRRSRAPQIVNILSVSSRQAFPKCSAYCASKFGALGFTRVIAEEFRPLGIRVTAVLPGSTSTRMSDEFDFDVVRESLMQPPDVAAAVIAALEQPRRAAMDEILLTPSRGNLAAKPGRKSSRRGRS